MMKLEGTTKRWIGTSADIKPQAIGGFGKDADSIPPGSTFLEADTGRIYRWTGDEWVAPPLEGQTAALLSTICDLLARIDEKVEAVLGD